jgi:predicted GNAT superfamily acetyltransferase
MYVVQTRQCSFTLRDLHSVEEFARVVALEKEIWGFEAGGDVVPVNLFAATVKRGAILLGAFDPQEKLAGFVYSFPGLKAGRVVQWSHMLGVHSGMRGLGLGYHLKLAQRERTLAQGIDLVEWTFDPLQAVNAHFNFAKLGVRSAEYLRDVYGPSESPLHRGTPTDRLIAEWHIASDLVLGTLGLAARSIDTARPQYSETGGATGSARRALSPINEIARHGSWDVCVGEPDLAFDGPIASIQIPADFTRMLSAASQLALEWRLTTRRIFETYFGRGYAAAEFVRAPDGGGCYILVRQ